MSNKDNPHICADVIHLTLVRDTLLRTLRCIRDYDFPDRSFYDSFGCLMSDAAREVIEVVERSGEEGWK